MKTVLTLSLCFVLFILLFSLAPRTRAERAQSSSSSSQGPQDVKKQVSNTSQLVLAENTKSQLRDLILEKRSRTSVQKKIDSQLLAAAKVKSGQQVVPAMAAMEIDVAYDTDGRTEVDISAAVTDNLLAAIVREGGEVISSYPQFNAVRARLRPESMETIAALSEVRIISRAAQAQVSRVETAPASKKRAPFHKRAEQVQKWLLATVPRPASVSTALHVPLTGNVTSEGDVTHRANQARTSFGVNGSGIKIGVISDSVKFLPESQSTGELPSVTVLSGRTGLDGGDLDSGEGTAMLEIIHDLAPGAQLFFSTGKGGPAAFAQNVLDLSDAGCDIIVDDLEYFDESPFQDAVIAQAVNTVTAAGVLYFSSAGNSGNVNDLTSSVWEGDFVDGGPIKDGDLLLGNALRFAAPSIIFNQTFTNSKGGKICLFWSDPLGASTNDYDVYIVDTSGNIVRWSNDAQNGTQDPFEIVPISNQEHVLVVKFSGANRYLQVKLQAEVGKFTWATAGNTKGHSAAVNAFSVAAVKAGTSYPSPFSGGATNPVETFSSDGPRRVFYNADGTQITPGNVSSTGGTVRQKPDIAAADGVKTSVPGFSSFFGTSAAAPHAAAIAALLLSFNPTLTVDQVRSVLTSTALDIEALATDRDSGAGIVMAHPALQSIATCPSANISFGQTINGSLTTSDCVFSGTTRRVDVYRFNGTAGQQIVISMNSSAFDTYLYLLNANNQTIAEDDDGGGSTNSRIPPNSGSFTLPTTSSYTLYATSFFSDSTGAYTLSLTASNCAFSLSPSSQIFISSASSGSFSVFTGANCSWNAVSNATWLTTNSSGTGNGTVSYLVAANTGNTRTGTISVAGQTFTVFQSAGNGTGCSSATITPGQTINSTLNTDCVFTGTSRYVDLYNFSGTAGQQVVITMSSTAFDTYLFLDSPNNQTIAQNDDGGGGTNSRIPANAGFFTLPTTGTYRIFATSFSSDGNTGSTGPYALSLSTATSCSYSLNPTNQSLAATAGSNSFNIVAPSGCAWTALSNASWITTTSSGSGNGTINYSVAANTGAARTGTISVGGQLFTVNQSAGSFVQLSLSSYTASESSGSATITVTRSGNTTGAATVNFVTSDIAGLQSCTLANGRASERCDYVTSLGTVRFVAGETSKTLTIPFIDDVLLEGNETFTISLSNATGASLGSPATATVTISDNDFAIPTTNPIDGVEFFIRQQYLDFLNRQPDPTGLQNWLNTLAPCPNGGFGEPPASTCDRLHVAAGFFQSDEFLNRGYWAFRFYMLSYNQRPTYAQFIPDMAQVGGPKTAAEEEASKVAFANAFVQRPEFLARYAGLTGQPLANALLQTAGLPSSTFAVSAGMTNSQILRGIVETSAVTNKFLSEGFVLIQYFGFLRRDPDPTGYQNNVNTLNANPNNLRHMIFIFIYSPEYRNRFGP